MHTLQKLRPWCFIVAFFTVMSCQKPDDVYMNESTSQGKSKIISLEELKAKPKAYEKIIRIIKNQNNRSKSTSAYDENYGISIVTDQILLYEDNGYESLTFSVYPDVDRGFVENLILVKEQDGEYTAYYIMYNFTEDERQRLATGENIAFGHEDYCGVPLDEFDNGVVMKSGGNIYSVSGIYERDGKCYRAVVYRTTVYSGIPGQKEYSEFQTVEVQVDCPQQDVDYSFGDNGGGGDPPAPDFGYHTFNPGELPGSYTGPGHTGSNPIRTTPMVFPGWGGCRQISDLLSNANYKNKLIALAGNVNDTLNEQGATMDINNNIVTLTPGPSLQPNLNPTDKYVAFSHIHNNHPDGTYSIFSFADLQTISVMLHNDKIDTGKFVATLSTSKGTHYAFTISSPKKFKKFFYYFNNSGTSQNMAEMVSSEKKANRLNDIYYKRRNNPKINQTDTDNANVLKQFLTFLMEADLGITLFETDATFETFKKVTLSVNGDISRDECE